MSHLDSIPSTPGKQKPDKSLRFHSSYPSKLTLYFIICVFLIFFLLLLSPSCSPTPRRHLSSGFSSSNSIQFKSALKSARPRDPSGPVVLVTGAAGFVGSHVSIALKRRGDADINDKKLLQSLFDAIHFTHVMHLAAQAGVRYAMQNPGSYVHSNIAGFVNLLEICKSANPQPSIIWASSSSVYGLNSKVPFSEEDRTDRPASLYAATKKAGEEIAHTYNHIYGLSII